MMIISGNLLPPYGEITETTPVTTPAANHGLSTGQQVMGRVSQVQSNGHGVLRLPDGSGFAFSGGHGLRAGEPVRLEVMRLVPEITFRLVASQSGGAVALAQSAEQSLMRAPDLLANLLSWAGLKGGSQVLNGGILAGSSPEESLFLALRAGGKAASYVTGKGETLAGIMQKSLPNVSVAGLLRGETAGLARLLEGGSREEVRDAVRLLRLGAMDLRAAGEEGAAPRSGNTDAELNPIRAALHRLGDLLAMQDVLPRAAPSAEGDLFLGYRLFWLTEGGLGEAIWRREQNRQRNLKSEEDSAVTTVLLSLNMTNLGVVQARLSYGDGQLLIAVSAQEESALAALRGQVGELRGGLLDAELPLRSLELSRLTSGEMKTERLRALGLGAGFSTEV